MSQPKLVKVTTPSGKVYKGYSHGGGRGSVFASTYDVRIFKHACILLHPYGRQRDDPLDKLDIGFPREVGGNVHLYGLIATCVNPETEEVLGRVSYKELPIFAEDSGTWIQHYKVDQIKGVRVVPKDSLT